MKSFYAPAARVKPHILEKQITLISKSPIISALLDSVSGLLAVVNEQRQVVALNTTFLSFLGIKNPSDMLGLRPGEVIKCIHAHDKPAGCGTTQYCSSCGAAIAMVTSLDTNASVEKICALCAEQKGKKIDLVLSVKAHPIVIDTKKFLLLFLQDISNQEQHAALERTFFHDINNSVNLLLNATDLLSEENPSRLATIIHTISLRLANEITLQRHLSSDRHSDFKPALYTITVGEVLEEVQAILSNHPLVGSKKITIAFTDSDIVFTSNLLLLNRILCNMLINALEATDKDGEIKIWTESTPSQVIFCVWNKELIPPNVSLRIFQRYYSSKAKSGRGIGTYSMKLFGEKYLNGKVDFSSTKEGGTIFRIILPRQL